MRTARRLIATLIGVAMWSVVATNVAFAMRVPDPPAGQAPKVTVTGGGGGTSNWKYALIAVLAVLLAVAIVGLVASLRHSRESRPSPMLHA